MNMSANSKILSINNLSVSFDVDKNKIIANQNISLNLNEGEVLGIVGESGSGKTVLCKSIIKLLPTPPAKYLSGEIMYNDKNILTLSDEALREIRKKEIAMIFQNPMSSFNPVRTVGSQVVENLDLKKKFSKKEAKFFGIDLLNKVGIHSPETRYDEYPHQWSGGMLQRAAIAMAIRNNPKILLADEPTTALDVTIQAQILTLLLDIQKKNNMSMILVSHDLAVVAETCDRIGVMYAGKLVEIANTQDLFKRPQHPYTVGLINSIPRINSNQKRLKSIAGTLKSISSHTNFCPFVERCEYSNQDCNNKNVLFKEVQKNHFTLCPYPERIIFNN